MGKQENLRAGRALARLFLAAGLLASLAANIAAAEPTTTGRAVSGIAPLFLFGSIEMLIRIPGDGSAVDRLRLAATTGIAGVAAWVSYWHMVALALNAGESRTSAHLLPLAVDGTILVASLSLVIIGRQIRPARKPDVYRPTGPPRMVVTDTEGPPPKRAGRADELRRLINDEGMTQKEAAAALGISERTARRDLNAHTDQEMAA